MSPSSADEFEMEGVIFHDIHFTGMTTDEGTHSIHESFLQGHTHRRDLFRSEGGERVERKWNASERSNPREARIRSEMYIICEEARRWADNLEGWAEHDEKW